MKKLKFKVVTGYRIDQFHSIEPDELHKVYYLFLNPDKRGILNDGTPIIGKNILDIAPDYHGIMGWNVGYNIEPTDYEMIEKSGIKDRVAKCKSFANQIALSIQQKPKLLQLPLSEIKKTNLLLQ